VVPTEGERISVKKHHAGDVSGSCQSGGGGNSGAERVPDEYGPHKAEALFETPKEREPVVHRVRAATFAVTERRQIESEDAVADPG
jgi:hypothetical protein